MNLTIPRSSTVCQPVTYGAVHWRSLYIYRILQVRLGNYAAPLRAVLQPAATPINLGQQSSIAGDEGMAEGQARAVQETTLLSDGM